MGVQAVPLPALLLEESVGSPSSGLQLVLWAQRPELGSFPGAQAPKHPGETEPPSLTSV